MKVSGIAEIEVDLDDFVKFFCTLGHEDQIEVLEKIYAKENANGQWVENLCAYAADDSPVWKLFESLGFHAGLVGRNEVEA